MRLLKIRNLYLALAAFGLCALPAGAQAGMQNGEFLLAANTDTNPGYCRSYAKRAIDAYNANQRQGCGFGGARWHPNSDHHYNWCLGVSRATAESESRARQRLLQDCKRGSPKETNEGYCRSYAKRAVDANKKNLKDGCGFGGARWHSNTDGHYNWCLNVPRRTAESESRARQRQLQGCK